LPTSPLLRAGSAEILVFIQFSVPYPHVSSFFPIGIDNLLDLIRYCHFLNLFWPGINGWMGMIGVFELGQH